MSYGNPKIVDDVYTEIQDLHNAAEYTDMLSSAKVLLFTKLVEQLATAYSAIHGPLNNPEVILRMNGYQADNLLEFLQAVVNHPEGPIGNWNTGDWWGELIYMLEAQGAAAERGNRKGAS